MLFDDIREELGNPNIYQVSKRQFEQMESEAIGKPYQIGASWGISSNYYPHIYIAPGMSMRARRNTIYHEMMHLMYPWRKHWWMALAGRVLADGGHRGEATPLYGHKIEELPLRTELLKQVRRQARRFNE